MSKTLSLFQFCGLFVLISCSPDEGNIDPNAPQPCFTVQEGDLYAEGGIPFDASCSQNATIYLWDFGDGNTSTLANPSHTYVLEGTYTVTLSIENDLNQTGEISKELTIQPSPFIKHSGFIDVPEVWGEGLHLITGNVTIRHGSLVIDPGAKIYFNNEKSISVGHRDTVTPEGALFMAIGTSAKPITFEPSSGVMEPGSWGHIFFTDKASASSTMDYCEIKYGGKADSWFYDGFTYYTNYGMVHVEKTGVSIQNSSVTGGANYAISLSADAYFTSFTGNILSENVNYPIYISMNYAHTIDAGNTILSDKGIYVHSQYFTQAMATWKKQDVAYILEGEKRLSAGNAGPSNLHIEPGTTIAFLSDAYIEVGLFTEGHLYAEGTETEPIIFTSAELTKAKGDWQAVVVHTESTFKYCQFEYGGRSTFNNHRRTLDVASDNVIITNCTIKESAGLGIDFGSWTNPNIVENNLISNCDSYGISISSKYVHALSFSNTIENTKGLEVNAVGIDGAVTWKKRSMPYTVSGYLYIQSVAGSSLTIEPGTTIHFKSGGGMLVANENTAYGTLIADGTTDPIIFTLADESITNGTGNWNNIRFGINTTADSRLINCQISHGGVDNIYGYGMIHCNNTTDAPVISDNTISNSSSFGISTLNATPVLSNNSFSNNASGDMTSF